MLIAFTLAVIFYFQKFDRTISQENETHLAETSEQTVEHALSILDDTTASLQAAAGALSALPDKEQRLSYLSQVKKELGFSYLSYAGKDALSGCSTL